MSTTRIENFPAHRLEAARDALALAHTRLVRQAARAGQAAPSAPALAVVARRVASRCASCREAILGFPTLGERCGGCISTAWRTIELVDLELVADRPVLAGWVFLAAVEPIEGGNLIRQVPGADVAEGELAPWAAGEIACDHCRTRRRRAETFIVRADGSDSAIPAGTYRQVGRQCVAAFLGGRSAASIVAQLAWPNVVRGAGDDDGEGGWGGGRQAELIDPTRFLAQVAAVIRVDGWVSRSAARAVEGRRSTADHALHLMSPPFGGDPHGDWRREALRCAPGIEDCARGAAALQWASDLSGQTDYERNLALVARQHGLRREHAGILASAVSAHMRALSIEVARDRLAAAVLESPSAHVGEVGRRMNLELTVQRVASVDTDYGALNIISMRDYAGNLFVWKTGAQNPKPGEQLRVRGSVKEHGEYRGEKQTVLTRCEVVAEFPPERPARGLRARARKSAPERGAIEP